MPVIDITIIIKPEVSTFLIGMIFLRACVSEAVVPVFCEVFHNEPPRAVLFYSETTWAVGIAQLTHHEVQSGGKNPETEGRGIFAPTANRVVS